MYIGRVRRQGKDLLPLELRCKRKQLIRPYHMGIANVLCNNEKVYKMV